MRWAILGKMSNSRQTRSDTAQSPRSKRKQ